MEPVTPLINDLNAPFWAAAAQMKLILPLCLDSGRCFWPPSPISPFSGGETGWRDSPGLGLLKTAATYRRPFQAAFQSLGAYAVGLVELDEGPRLNGFIAAPDDDDAPRPGDLIVLVMLQVVSGGLNVPVIQARAAPETL